MSKVQMLRALVKQRLTAAVEETFGLFERTIAEYEEQLCRSKEENERQRKLLDAVFNPQLQLHIAVFPADVQQLSVVNEEVPTEQQEWSSSLDQEDPEPPHIKEEQEELWTSQEGEQLQGLEEADIKIPFTPVPGKSEEDDEEKPQSSQLQQRQTEQMETEADDYPAPETHLQIDADEETGDSSEPETGDSDDWKETKEPQLGLNSLDKDEVPVCEARCTDGEKPFSCSECGKTFGFNTSLKKHMVTHTGEKPFSCSVCKKSFARRGNLKCHMRIHTGEKPFSCSVCKKSFRHTYGLKYHMTTHTGEKPFSCSVCNTSFALRGHLKSHMTTHTREKPFSCSVCNTSFARGGILKSHMTTHTGEKPFSCSVCGKGFSRKQTLVLHLRTHTVQTADGEDCGGPEPARNSDPDTHVQPDTEDKTGVSSHVPMVMDNLEN